MQTDILVIGAGASGLMAAMHLARAGEKVLVLEASDRTGGRIHTLTDADFPEGVELGAEFVHGQLPVTLDLLQEAGIKPYSAVGDMWRYADGKFNKSDQFLLHYDLIIEKLNALTDDITLDGFLNIHFAAAEYTETANMLRNFAAGYDTADPARFSAFAMRSELQSEDEGHQYRIEGGYTTMINYLEQQIIKAGSNIKLSTPVKQLDWRAGKVTAITLAGEQFEARQVLLALPLGVLQAAKNELGAITFNPPIPQREQAIQQMGMGAVIKILLRFDSIFWNAQALKRGSAADVNEMSYLFSSESIPTWWTQHPSETPILTGWLGGPAAAKFKSATDEEILNLALTSLSNIYDLPIDDLQQKLTAAKIMNWPADPYARGSYSYATVATGKARELLLQPEQNTIYFCGEAFYDGPEMGTVEAALASGKDVAARMVKGGN